MMYIEVNVECVKIMYNEQTSLFISFIFVILQDQAVGFGKKIISFQFSLHQHGAQVPTVLILLELIQAKGCNQRSILLCTHKNQSINQTPIFQIIKLYHILNPFIFRLNRYLHSCSTG